MVEYEAVIGLEIHAQLLTGTKIFCGCPNRIGGNPNHHGCPVCLGMPGSLPVLNREAVALAIRAGLATGCRISGQSVFARKNYFYPDLPKGYQISQYDRPLCEDGEIEILVNGHSHTVRLTRIHMEEDAGKLVHDQDPTHSFFDVNRCGTPLVEIVTEPDMRTPEEAKTFLENVKQLLEYVRVSDCNMEEGSLRADANVSVRPRGQSDLGTKTEIKNLNSFRGVVKALKYEINRQIETCESGERVVQETFLWDPNNGRTISMRTKEDAHDYRYFPDPDLIPLQVTDDFVQKVEAELPELPRARRQRFVDTLGLREYDAGVLAASRETADYFEAVLTHVEDARLVSNWVQTEILRYCREMQCGIADLKASPVHLGKLLLLVNKGELSANAAKEVLAEIVQSGEHPEAIVERKGLKQVSDSAAIEPLVDRVIAENPKEAEAYRSGKTKLIGFFVGQIMRATQGQANPAIVNKLLKERLAPPAQ